MHYLVACALRGPDDQSKEAENWKHLVTSRLRWLVVKHYDLEGGWCKGWANDLRWYEVDEFILNSAKEFAQLQDSSHVKEHVRLAFEILIKKFPEDSKIQAYFNKLIIEGLL